MLRGQCGFWVPPTYTTRGVERDDLDLIHVEQEAFLSDAKAGQIVLPASFGGVWYGWHKRDLDTMRDGDGRAVLNVRPYTALILEALLDGFVGVWLTIDDAELSVRRTVRGATRDTDAISRSLRDERDREDSVYQQCFENVLVAEDGLIQKLLELTQ